MNAPAKYLFDIDFAPAAKAATTIALTEHKTIVAEAETRGYRNGFQAAEAEMKAETARRLAIALEQVGLMMEFAHAVATKLAPALIAREPLAEIEALATGCFRQLLKSPHVVVRVSDKLYDAARAKLEEIAQQTGFEGRLVMLAEPEIAEGDCRIEWADGGVTRDRAAAEALIAETVNRFVTARHVPAD